MCSGYEKELLEEYKDTFELVDSEWIPLMGHKERIKASIKNRLQHSMGTVAVKKPMPRMYWLAAASVVLLLSVGLLILKNSVPAKRIFTKNIHNKKYEIKPGGNKAILTLADGSTVNLDDSAEGNISQQGLATVNKTGNGKLVYNLKGKQPAGQALYNIATTPRGGQYQLVLSDGTKVWLNAASSIKFPVAFAGKERHVELTGEAYFEVAKNKNMPFTIAAKGGVIEVLGTHFNVSAYADEKHMVTTLLEGAVKLKKDGKDALLKPGQQAITADGESGYKVSDVNTDAAVAWKNGYFVFDNENIQSIMKKVSRWYDVDITYKEGVADQSFGGTVSRFSNVSELLKMLELTGTIHFTTEGRVITAKP